MPLPRPPAGVARIAVSGHNYGAGWVNVFWALLSGYETADGSDMTDLATDFAGAYRTRFQALKGGADHATGCQVVLYKSGSEVVSDISFDDAGGASGAPLASGTAAVISWGIDGYWRGGKPRTYLSGMVVGSLASADQYLGSFVTSLSTAGAGFLGDVNGFSGSGFATVTLGTLSRYSGGAPRTPPIFFPFFTAQGRPGIGSVRRRNNYAEH